MSKYNRDLESLLQNDRDLMVKYQELLCLRAEIARLVYRSNSSAREDRITRAARAVKRNQARVAFSPAILLPKPERPQV